MNIMDICSSSQLFAAYHVLHRLLVPRHSPCALSSLTLSFITTFLVNRLILKLLLVFLVYLIFHLYIFQCAFFVILNFVLLRQVSFKIVRCAQALSHNFSITFLVLLVYNPKSQYYFKSNQILQML